MRFKRKGVLAFQNAGTPFLFNLKYITITASPLFYK